jgi:hypothetical protein
MEIDQLRSQTPWPRAKHIRLLKKVRIEREIGRQNQSCDVLHATKNK